MNQILITYVSHTGSTREIAGFMGRELSAQGMAVDVKPTSEITDLDLYDTIIAGGLVYRFGCHPDVVKFLKKNVDTLAKKRIALFVVGLRLVKTQGLIQASFPIFIDPAIMKNPQDSQKKSLVDSFTTMKFYLQAALPVIEQIHPVSLAFFAGKLELHSLGVSEKLIMLLLMLLVGKKPGDYRNWDKIRSWVKELRIAHFEVSQLAKIPEFENSSSST
jgi:menaquinone-dependent protoporphyrinogen IX oxidase